MRSPLIKDLLKNTPLDIRLKVSIQSYFLMKYGGSFFIHHDEEGNEYVDDETKLALEESRILEEKLLRVIEIWELDGSPK